MLVVRCGLPLSGHWLRVTPAMASGLSETLRDVNWIVGLIEARETEPGPRGPYEKRQPEISN